MNLNQKLKDIQVHFKAKKTRFNSFGKYYFRSAEDILEAIKPHLTKHNVSVIVNEDFVIGEFGPIIKTTATITDGTDSISAAAVVGVDAVVAAAAVAIVVAAAVTVAVAAGVAGVAVAVAGVVAVGLVVGAAVV